MSKKRKEAFSVNDQNTAIYLTKKRKFLGQIGQLQNMQSLIHFADEYSEDGNEIPINLKLMIRKLVKHDFKYNDAARKLNTADKDPDDEINDYDLIFGSNTDTIKIPKDYITQQKNSMRAMIYFILFLYDQITRLNYLQSKKDITDEETKYSDDTFNEKYKSLITDLKTTIKGSDANYAGLNITFQKENQKQSDKYQVLLNNLIESNQIQKGIIDVKQDDMSRLKSTYYKLLHHYRRIIRADI